MTFGKSAILAVFGLLATPVLAVDSMFLDSVPITYPGDYLAPDNFYLLVPPPSETYQSAQTLAPATIYDINIMKTQYSSALTTGSVAYAGSASLNDSESDSTDVNLRVLIKQGLDHASDVPVSVLREHFSESENIDLVAEGETYDIVVEVETMKPDSSPIIFIVINAYKDVDDEQVIFYNNFGYLGELKLLAGSAPYATHLESALQKEIELLQDENK